MNYIDTIFPLSNFFSATVYQSQDDYFKKTGKAASFNQFQAIKNWYLPIPEGVRPNQIIPITVLAKTETGNYIESNGKFLIEVIPVRASSLPIVNIPPPDFNFTANSYIPIIEPPLKDGFEKDYDVVRSPDGFSMVARNKKLYEEFLKNKDATSSAGTADFQKSVVLTLNKLTSDIELIKKALMI